MTPTQRTPSHRRRSLGVVFGIAGLGLALAAGCSSTPSDNFDSKARLAELDAIHAAPATASQMESARLYLTSYIQALRSTEANAVENWRRRAGRAPEAKVVSALIDARDPILGTPLTGLPAIYLGKLANSAGPEDVTPALLEMLHDVNPEWRAYAAQTLGYVGDGRADDTLAEMLTDMGAASRMTVGPTVAVVAASALAQRGDPIGLDLMLAAARLSSDAGESGPLPYRRHFERYAGSDLGADIAAYEAWFERFPPRIR